MKLAILEYSSGTVDIIDTVPYLRNNEEIEGYLVDVLEYNLDEISWMTLDKGGINFLEPDDFSYDEEVAEHYELTASVHVQYDDFVKRYGHSPKYANCTIMFYDEDEVKDVVIKLSTENDEQDNKVFYYCSGLDDFTRLCYSDGEDFLVIGVPEFTDSI